MRILKWLGVIVGLLVVGFFAIGIVTPKFSYHNAITVDTPVEKAFSKSQPSLSCLQASSPATAQSSA